MKICYLDAFSGISGDMTVGALVDAGANADEISEGLRSLSLGAEVSFEKTKRHGMAATKFRVEGGEQKAHRHLPHIVKIIERGAVPDSTKQKALAVFHKLAQAEAKAHAVPMEKVHFHEVGAVDSICDIVAACHAFDLLGIAKIYCSPVNVGSGTVETEHGTLPIPAPATAALLFGKPIYARGPEMELTTPTGAAIAVALSESFGSMPAMSITSSGYGAGDRDFKQQANVLRALVGESTGASEATTVSVIEANIDDSNPQILAYTSERLMNEGALDVALMALTMKKGRPGTMLQVIARPEDQERLAQIVFSETTTLGLRIHTAERRVLERHFAQVETVYGAINIKSSESGFFTPEYEDCRKAAQAKNVPLKEVLAAANHAYLKSKE